MGGFPILLWNDPISFAHMFPPKGVVQPPRSSQPLQAPGPSQQAETEPLKKTRALQQRRDGPNIFPLCGCLNSLESTWINNLRWLERFCLGISKELARSDLCPSVRISRMLARECQAANEEPEPVKVKPSNSAATAGTVFVFDFDDFCIASN